MTYIGIGTFFLGSSVAMLIKPGYSFKGQWLSDLGTGDYAALFNFTLILTAIFTSSFYPITFYLLRQNGYSTIKSITGMFLGVTSFIFLSLIGLFNLENDLHNLHVISSIGFIVSTSFAQLLLLSGFGWYTSVHLISSPAMDTRLSYTSLVVAIVFGFVFVEGIPFQQQILQKLTIYLLIFTILYQSTYVWQSDELLSSD